MSERAGLLLFAAASAVAVACGAAALALEGAPPSVWLRNPAAWAAGALLAWPASRLNTPNQLMLLAAAAMVLLLATFAAAPVQGVHRWIDVGPLHVSAAALVLPALIVSLARLQSWVLTLAGGALAGAALVSQPDASQATALAGALALVLVHGAAPATARVGGVLLFGLIAVASLFRPDPLEPVPEVEGIFGLMSQAALPLALLAAIALGLACLAPVVRSGASKCGAPALALYFLLVAIAPTFGAFPVPLAGLGMSFPLGWWIGMALLARDKSSPD